MLSVNVGSRHPKSYNVLLAPFENVSTKNSREITTLGRLIYHIFLLPSHKSGTSMEKRAHFMIRKLPWPNKNNQTDGRADFCGFFWPVPWVGFLRILGVSIVGRWFSRIGSGGSCMKKNSDDVSSWVGLGRSKIWNGIYCWWKKSPEKNKSKLWILNRWKTPPKDICLKKNTNILPTKWTLTNYEWSYN